MTTTSFSAHRTTARRPLRRSDLRVVAPALQLPETAGAEVFSAVRQHGPIAREAIAGATSLSVATVNRQVSALLEAGLLLERADLAPSGAIGRPRRPVVVNHEPFLTLGLHIGAKATSIVAADLLGRTLDVVETPTPNTGPKAALAALASSASRYLTRWQKRRPLWIGVTIGGTVHGGTGHVDHPRLGWSAAPVGPVLAAELGLPVSVASHVDAMAGAELLFGGRVANASSSLYVYARETVGYALVIGGRVHSPAGGPGTIAGLPAHSEMLGGATTLESIVSDEAVLAAARRLRLSAEGNGTGATAVTALVREARAGNERLAELLNERARALGEAVALLRDVLNPDDLVVGGQGFTEYPEAMAALQRAFTQRSVLPTRALRVTAFGNRVQEAGAGTVSLSALYADPVGAMRRSRGPVATAVPDVSA